MTRAKGPKHIVGYRRRREGVTKFSKRLSLIKGRKTRMVVRKSNRNLVIQFVDFDAKGDKTQFIFNSVQLKKLFKWPSARNSWTAYLAGLYAGKEAAKKGVKEVIPDIGRHTPTKGSVVFAAIKGAADAGIKCAFSDDVVPTDKISNPPEKVKSLFEEVKKKIAG